MPQFQSKQNKLTQIDSIEWICCQPIKLSQPKIYEIIILFLLIVQLSILYQIACFSLRVHFNQNWQLFRPSRPINFSLTLDIQQQLSSILDMTNKQTYKAMQHSNLFIWIKVVLQIVMRNQAKYYVYQQYDNIQSPHRLKLITYSLSTSAYLYIIYASPSLPYCVVLLNVSHQCAHQLRTFVVQYMSQIVQKIVSVDGSILFKRYQLLSQLGRGSFAHCWKVRHEGSDKIYALKIIPKQNMEVLKQQRLLSQIAIHQSLSHPHIVYLDHAFEDLQNEYIVLEYCTEGTLEERCPKQKEVEESTIRYYALQILDAIKYLHSKKILHRDLKLSNCFITEGDQVKIGDFGFACKLQSHEEFKRQTCGTPNFLSPEVAGGFGHSYPSDIWSFGVILFRLKYGYCPFETDSLGGTIQRIKTVQYTFSKWISISPELKDLIQRIFQIDYDARPTIAEIEQHQFFRGKNRQNSALKKVSSLKGFITRIFSKQKDTRLSKVDSCKNLKEIKSILRDKTQEKQSVQQTSSSKQQPCYFDTSKLTKITTASTIKSAIKQNPVETTNFAYFGKAPQPKTTTTSRLNRNRSPVPSITQYIPHFLIYEIDTYQQYLILYLTNGLRQIIKDKQNYTFLNGQCCVDRNGIECNERPRTIDYILRQKVKQSQFKISQQTFYQQVKQKKYISKWSTISTYKLFMICGATVLTTGTKNLFYIKSDYCQCLYNNRLEIVINQSLLARCKLTMLDHCSMGSSTSRQRKLFY